MPVSRQIASSDVVLPERSFGQAAGGQRFELFNSGDDQHPGVPFALGTTYSQWTNGVPTPGSGVKDVVGYLGWNMVTGGSLRAVAGQPSMGFRAEYDYQNASYQALELYAELGNAAATITWRPWIAVAKRDATTGSTFATGLDLYGPGLTGGDAPGIRFYAATTAVEPIIAGEQTFQFEKGALKVLGFSTMSTSLQLQAGAGQSSQIRLGYGGTEGAGLVTMSSPTALDINIGAPSLRVSQRNTTGLSLGLNTSFAQAALEVCNQGHFSNAKGITIRQATTPSTGNMHECVSNNGATLFSGANKAGIPFVAVNSAPADGDIAAGQCFWWFDPTNGAPKVMFKGKQADGTVRSGSLALL